MEIFFVEGGEVFGGSCVGGLGAHRTVVVSALHAGGRRKGELGTPVTIDG